MVKVTDNLEENINKQLQTLERWSTKAVLIEKPFLYMARLAIAGEKQYGVDSGESFERGVNAALDYYNCYKKKDEQIKIQSLVHGAKTVIDYIAGHMKEQPYEDEDVD